MAKNKKIEEKAEVETKKSIVLDCDKKDIKDKKQALKDLVKSIEKDFGKGSIMKLGDMPAVNVDCIPTGILSLDLALGGNGIPRGRIIEIYGEPSTGKSSLALNIIKQAQNIGGQAAYVDVENAMDSEYAKKIGVDVDNLLLSQPDTGEQALEIVEKVVRSGIVDFVVVDSVAALVPKAEIEGNMGDSHMGLQARLMSQAMRKLTSIISKTKCSVMFINQTRCISKDAMILTPQGIKYIEHLNVGDKVVKSQTEYITVVNNVNSGLVNGQEIEIKHRGKWKLSNNHMQPILSDGKRCEKMGEELNKGDWIIQPILNNNIPNNVPYIKLDEIISNIKVAPNAKKNVLPNILDEDLAFFMGCYYSDGYMHEDESKSDYRICLAEKNEERSSLIIDITHKLFPDGCSINAYEDSTKIRLGGSYIVEFFKALGLLRYGKNKIVPNIILESRESVIRSFLRGVFFDSHGIGKEGIIFSNENNFSTYQIANLLYYYGIFADLKKDDKDFYNRLYITGNDAHKFNELIGFAEGSKSKKMEDLCACKNARGKYDVVPFAYGVKIFELIKGFKKQVNISELEYYGSFKMCLHKNINCSRLKLIELLTEMLCKVESEDIKYHLDFIANNRFAEIIGVNDCEFEAIDIETDGDHTFIADRFLTHNSKIGVVYGNPMTTSGGNALRFYSSVRMEIKKADIIKKGEEIIGNKVLVKVVKNKIAPPFREARFDIIFGKGMPKESPIVDSAVEYGIVEKSGSWYNYKEVKIGQGKEQAVEYLKNNAKICDEIELVVMAKYREKNNGVVVVNTSEEVDEDGVFITGTVDEVNVKGNEEA